MREFLEIAREWSILSVTIRLALALITGCIIGFEREMKRRGAGLKTHVLVCLGATLVMLTGQFIYNHFEGTMDVARLGAQVISGVGFLGVGTIIVTGRNQVRGLTTAAGLWACACLGLAIGIGFVEGAFVALLLVVFSFRVLAKVDSWIQRHTKYYELYLEFPTNKSVSVFIDELHKREIKICSFELGKSKLKGEGPNALLSISVKDRRLRGMILDEIRKMDCVRYVEEL